MGEVYWLHGVWKKEMGFISTKKVRWQNYWRNAFRKLKIDTTVKCRILKVGSFEMKRHVMGLSSKLLRNC